MPTPKITIAVVQQRVSGDREKDMARARDRVAFAADKGAHLVAFPELFGWRWFADRMDRAAFDLAETADGPRVAEWRDIAKSSGVAVAAPMFLSDGQGAYRNALLWIDGAGEIRGAYHGVHLSQIPGWEERFYFSPGDDFPVFEIGGMKVGLLICWDAFFPEAFRALAVRGASAVVVATSAIGSGEDLWQRALGAQAFMNGVYVVRANRVASDEDLAFCGASFAVDPAGDLLGDPMGDGEGVGLFDIDGRAVELTRREFPFLKDRRPEAYLDLAGVEIRRRVEERGNRNEEAGNRK
ncbi:acyltransferase [bacterium]|nr:acyltransferase [bacterium]